MQQLPAETPIAYDTRRRHARLYPFYKDAVRGLASRLREANPIPSQETNEKIVSWYWKNNPTKLVYRMDISGIREGHSFVLLSTKDDWDIIPILIKASEMEEFYPENPEQGEEIEYIRFKRYLRDTTAQITVERTGNTLLKTTNISGLISEEVIPLPEIPIVKFQYSEDQFFPYFVDVLYLNQSHWISTSFQENALKFSRFNLLWTDSLDSETEMSGIGPHTMIKLKQPGAVLGALEGGGAGIEAGRQDLLDLERVMTELSARPLIADGFKSATEVNRSGKKEDAPIMRLADMRVTGFIELFRKYSMMIGEDISDPLSYDAMPAADLSSSISTPQDAQNLLQAFVAGAIDRKTYIDAIVRAIPALKGVDPADISDRLGGGDGA